MTRAERHRLERETRKAYKDSDNCLREIDNMIINLKPLDNNMTVNLKALDDVTINFEPYKLLTFEEKQQHIMRMLQIPLDKLLAKFESEMRKLEFIRQNNNGWILFKARTEEDFTEEEFIELNAKNISGYKAKKEELIEIINKVKTINQWE